MNHTWITMKNTMKNAKKMGCLPTHRLTDTATYALGTRDAAWAFMRACEGARLSVGFPSLRAPYTVQVGIRTNPDRELADKLSGGAEVVDYAFAGSEITYS